VRQRGKQRWEHSIDLLFGGQGGETLWWLEEEHPAQRFRFAAN